MSDLVKKEEKSIATIADKHNDMKDIIKKVYAKDATDIELMLFSEICNTTGLSPIKRQIYFTKIWDSETKSNKMTSIVSVDGLRSLAEQTGKYAGQTIPLFCGSDMKWREVWLDNKNPPLAAKVGVLNKDFKEPLYAIAKYDVYVKKTKEGTPNKFWREMPDTMLAKCAESLALRKAFPQKLSNLYSEEEMDNKIIDVTNSDSNETLKKEYGMQLSTLFNDHCFAMKLEEDVSKTLKKCIWDEVLASLNEKGIANVDKIFFSKITHLRIHYLINLEPGKYIMTQEEKDGIIKEILNNIQKGFYQIDVMFGELAKKYEDKS